MTPTQMARRSDALYADGTCGMTRRVLCDMVAQKESDLEDARLENTALCDLLLRSYESFEEVYDRCDIDDSWRMETALEDMRVWMRELGVKVD